MKIIDFKEGNLICRINKTKKYISDPDYIGACFMFSEIMNNVIYLMMIYYPPNLNENGSIYEFKLEEYNDDSWDIYKTPKLKKIDLIESLNVKLLEAKKRSDIVMEKVYQSTLNSL